VSLRLPYRHRSQRGDPGRDRPGDLQPLVELVTASTPAGVIRPRPLLLPRRPPPPTATRPGTRA